MVMKRLVVFFIVLVSFSAKADTIYLCNAYSGGSFWSQAVCSKHSALIDRIVNVPSGLPFDQQVSVAQQSRSSATATQAVPVTTAQVIDGRTECPSLASQITNLDSMARQPQSGQTQDWIRGEKTRLRDLQRKLQC